MDKYHPYAPFWLRNTYHWTKREIEDLEDAIATIYVCLLFLKSFPTCTGCSSSLASLSHQVLIASTSEDRDRGPQPLERVLWCLSSLQSVFNPRFSICWRQQAWGIMSSIVIMASVLGCLYTSYIVSFTSIRKLPVCSLKMKRRDPWLIIVDDGEPTRFYGWWLGQQHLIEIIEL